MSDRDKVSLSELDKQKQKPQRKSGNGKSGGGGSASRGRKGQRRSRWASDAYKRRVDERLFGKKNDAGRSNAQERLRKAHGSPAFLRTYREYVRDFGMPDDLTLLLLLLELDAEDEVLKVMSALDAQAPEGSPDEKNLLRRRLQNMEMTTGSDALAEAAADMIGRL